MKYFKNIILTLAICLSGITVTYAQTAASSNSKSFVFSAIKGTQSKPDSLNVSAGEVLFKWINGDTSFFKLINNKKGKLVLSFVPSANFLGIARAKMQLKNSAGKIITEINLTGLSTNGLEGENEAPLSLVVDALGYQTNIGWTSLANHSRPELQGDEITPSLFRKSGKEKVEIIPVARYSPDFELPFGYYINSSELPVKKQVGVLAKAGAYPEHQILFPSISQGTTSFDPGNQAFGFYATGPTHTEWSEDIWNMLLYPEHAVRATRVYPLKDASGKLLLNTYLLCFEEAKNGDYNDYVFLVKNVTPVTNDPFQMLFNGNDLNGWHTFLRNIGTNTDPNNNFRIENNALHVIGKDLGYVITEKGYANFHFKVDFKWGEKRWPPREGEKRDAGICYNIPVNEPDSIWPQSIECQIQEGDVGDFWLLGFSTITVKGVKNVPANHTRMIKEKDAERPHGEWNTVEVISYNGKCVHIVNGVIVNVGENASVKGGKILLQSEYAEVYYQNIKIREL